MNEVSICRCSLRFSRLRFQGPQAGMLPGPHKVGLNPRVDLMLLSRKRTKPARRAVTAAGMSGRNRAFRGRGGVQAAGPGILASLEDLLGTLRGGLRGQGRRLGRGGSARPGDGHLSTMMIGSSGT